MKKEIISSGIILISIISIISADCVQVMSAVPYTQNYDEDCYIHVNDCTDKTASMPGEWYDQGICQLWHQTNCDCKNPGSYTECSSTTTFKSGNKRELSVNRVYNEQMNKSACDGCNGITSVQDCSIYQTKTDCESHYWTYPNGPTYDCQWTEIDGKSQCNYQKQYKNSESGYTTLYFHPCDPTKTNPCEEQDEGECEYDGQIIVEQTYSDTCYKCTINSKGCFSKTEVDCNNPNQGNSCTDECTPDAKREIEKEKMNLYTGDVYYETECQKCQKISTGCYSWMKIDCKQADPTQAGKNCKYATGEGFVDLAGNCVEKNCKNLFGENYEACGENEKKQKSFACCPKSACNDGEKSDSVCCKEGEIKETKSVWGTNILWCNPKQCKYETAQGGLFDSDDKKVVNINICCKEGEIATYYEEEKGLGYKFRVPFCGLANSETKSKCITDKKGNPVYCSEGTKCTLVSKKNNVFSCLPESCTSSEQTCTGQGDWTDTTICCPQYSACFWHPNGKPTCVSLGKEQIPATIDKDKNQVKATLPHASYYVVRDSKNFQVEGTAYKIYNSENIENLELTINYDESKFSSEDNLILSSYSDEEIENSCTIKKISSIDDVEKISTETSTTVKTATGELYSPKKISGRYSIFEEVELSNCQIEEYIDSIPNLGDLSETKSEDEDSSKKCFVATAVYDDENAPEVETLREVRDNVLKKSDLGNAFVDFYYSGVGRETADFVKTESPILIPFIKEKLDKIVEIYNFI